MRRIMYVWHTSCMNTTDNERKHKTKWEHVDMETINAENGGGQTRECRLIDLTNIWYSQSNMTILQCLLCSLQVIMIRQHLDNQETHNTPSQQHTFTQSWLDVSFGSTTWTVALHVLRIGRDGHLDLVQGVLHVLYLCNRSGCARCAISLN